MRTTIDIPDETYRELKIRAASQGTTVRQLVLNGIEEASRKSVATQGGFVVPVIASSRPGTLRLTNEQIDELTTFS